VSKHFIESTSSCVSPVAHNPAYACHKQTRPESPEHASAIAFAIVLHCATSALDPLEVEVPHASPSALTTNKAFHFMRTARARTMPIALYPIVLAHAVKVLILR
jgi:hypothetical protein